MDVDVPLSDTSFFYPPHSLQTVTQCLPGAASTAVVDYADTLGNSQAVQRAVEPSYYVATTGPIYETTSRNSQHASLSIRPPQPVDLTGTSDAALLAHAAERRISPQEEPKMNIHAATMNIRSRRKKRLSKYERDMIKKAGRGFTDGLNATQNEARGERNAQNGNGKQAVSRASHPEASIQDWFTQLTVNDNNHPGHFSAYSDRFDHLLQTTATVPVKAEEPTVGFGFTGRSDITATSSQTKNSGRPLPDFLKPFSDSASWASLTAQALKNRAKIGKPKEQQRKVKLIGRPRDLPKRLAELEKQITTLRHSGPSSNTLEKKITNITRQALSVRVRIEEGEGRLTVPEAKELRRANARMLSRKNKKTDHEKGVETLVDQVAMLL
ncbi:hypothetical protein MMC27_001730 [Xylographa pallens]|nr:hypothetical protein [Xylographa pallens]